MIQKKICMVGVFATGKTSLVKRFVFSKFSEKYHSTVGVKIDRKAVTVGGADVTLLLWDLEGKDGMQDIRTSYLKGSSGVLFVADGTRRETVTELDALHALTRETIGEVPFVVALNKADLGHAWQVTDADQAALADRGWHVLRTSAKTGDGVEDAFTWLAEAMVAP